ncbi:MAG: hypothetical protein PHG85_07350, partial [Candidatus Altiarchaeota archaeon]|nr:hypothetical protein [Candidatus Altiarchaeota archaeon]
MDGEKAHDAGRKLEKFIALLQLLTYVIACIALLNLAASLFSSLGPTDGVPPFRGDIPDTGDAAYTLRVKNPGFLGSETTFGVRLATSDWA